MKAVLVCTGALLALHLTTPFWWWIIIVPFVCGIVLVKTGWQGFRTGMVSAGLLWFLSVFVMMVFRGSGIIARRVADLMMVQSPWVLAFITALIAALAAGCAGLTGFYFKKLWGKSN